MKFLYINNVCVVCAGTLKQEGIVDLKSFTMRIMRVPKICAVYLVPCHFLVYNPYLTLARMKYNVKSELFY